MIKNFILIFEKIFLKKIGHIERHGLKRKEMKRNTYIEKIVNELKDSWRLKEPRTREQHQIEERTANCPENYPHLSKDRRS